MLKNVLKTIKVDMRETRSNKKYMQAMLKAELAKLEIRRREALAENNDMADEDSRSWLNRQINKAYNSRRQDVINDVFSRWHNDQSYHYNEQVDYSELFVPGLTQKICSAFESKTPKLFGVSQRPFVVRCSATI